MSRCLYCGQETHFGGSSFCRGHHRIYKRVLLQELANGTITEEHMEHLRRFNWLPAELDVPFLAEEVQVSKAPKARTRRVRKAKEVGTDVSFRKFGVELECVCPIGNDANVIREVNNSGYEMVHTGYTHNDVPHWKSLYDGSVRGDYGYESKEYVSPAFDKESGLDEVANVCKIIIDNGGKVNRTTGTHIHLDASDLSAQEIAKIVYLYGKLESKINALLPLDRRNNRYCKSVKRFCKYVELSGFDYFDNVQKVIRVLGTRYLKVNVEAYLRHGTIEFRQLNGTLSGDMIKYWVKLCTRIVDFVKSGKDVTNLSGNLYKVLGCKEDEIAFWKAVRESLAA